MDVKGTYLIHHIIDFLHLLLLTARGNRDTGARLALGYVGS
jgi:hypothetical protein